MLGWLNELGTKKNKLKCAYTAKSHCKQVEEFDIIEKGPN